MRKLLIGIAILFISFSCVKENNVKHIITEFYNSSSTNVLVVAHRGDWRHAPENSIKGIENSIEMGVDIVEIDVRKTKDNQLVLMHDGTIDRTTNGKGKVSDFTLDELHQFYLKNNQGGKDAELTDQKIPTLEEALQAAKGKIMLNLDKAYGIMKDIYPILEKTQTFDHIIMKGGADAKQVLKDISLIEQAVHFMPVMSSSKDSAEMKINEHLELYNPIGFEFILSKHDSIMELSGYIKSRGARVWVNTLWGSLCLGHTDAKALENPDSNWGWVIKKGANIIQTDNPKELLYYLEEKGFRNF